MGPKFEHNSFMSHKHLYLLLEDNLSAINFRLMTSSFRGHLNFRLLD